MFFFQNLEIFCLGDFRLLPAVFDVDSSLVVFFKFFKLSKLAFCSCIFLFKIF